MWEELGGMDRRKRMEVVVWEELEGMEVNEWRKRKVGCGVGGVWRDGKRNWMNGGRGRITDEEKSGMWMERWMWNCVKKGMN